jgi:hypothetical protein
MVLVLVLVLVRVMARWRLWGYLLNRRGRAFLPAAGNPTAQAAGASCIIRCLV